VPGLNRSTLDTLIELGAADIFAKYSEDQPRDERGRFGETDGPDLTVTDVRDIGWAALSEPLSTGKVEIGESVGTNTRDAPHYGTVDGIPVIVKTPANPTSGASEVAAQWFNDRFGFDVLTPRIEWNYTGDEPVLVSLRVDGTSAIDYVERAGVSPEFAADTSEADRTAIAFFDTVMGNGDRTGENLLVSEGRLVAIDNASLFFEDSQYRFPSVAQQTLGNGGMQPLTDSQRGILEDVVASRPEIYNQFAGSIETVPGEQPRSLDVVFTNAERILQEDEWGQGVPRPKSRKYSEDQPRDHGRFAEVEGTGSSEMSASDALSILADNSASSADEVRAAIKATNAEKVEFPGSMDQPAIWVTPGENPQVIEWDGKSDFSTVAEAHDWLWQQDVTDYYPNADQQWNDEFWNRPEALYHGTPDENVASILSDGLEERNATRGISNRYEGAAVYTSTEPDEIEFYGTVIAIDTAAMARDGVKPFVSQEPDIAEDNLRSALSDQIGLYDYSGDIEGGMSQTTVVINGAVPAQYVSVDHIAPKARKYSEDQPRDHGRFAETEGADPLADVKFRIGTMREEDQVTVRETLANLAGKYPSVVSLIRNVQASPLKTRWGSMDDRGNMKLTNLGTKYDEMIDPTLDNTVAHEFGHALFRDMAGVEEPNERPLSIQQAIDHGQSLEEARATIQAYNDTVREQEARVSDVVTGLYQKVSDEIGGKFPSGPDTQYVFGEVFDQLKREFTGNPNYVASSKQELLAEAFGHYQTGRDGVIANIVGKAIDEHYGVTS